MLMSARSIPTPLALRPFDRIMIWIHLRALKLFDDMGVRSSDAYRAHLAASCMALLRK